MKRAKSVAMTWNISYIVVLAVVMLIALSAQLNVYRTARKFAVQIASQSIEQEMTFWKDLSDNMKRVYYRLYDNEQMRGLLRANGSTPMSQLELKKISNTMFDLTSTEKSSYFSVYIVYNNLNLVMTPQVSMDVYNFHKVHYDASYVPFSQWRTLMASYHAGEFVRLANGDILYLKSLYLDNAYQNAATVVMYIPVENLEQMLDRDELYQEYAIVLLYDKNNDFLYTSNLDYLDELRSGIDAGEKKDGDGSKTIRLKSGKYYLRSAELADLKIEFLLKKSYVTQNMYWTQFVSGMAFVIILLVGMALSRFFVKRNMQPVQSLLALLMENPNGQETENEFKLLHSKTVEMLQMQKNLSSQVNFYQHQMEKERFRNILQSKQITQADMQLVLKNPAANYFEVVLCVIANDGVFAEDDGTPNAAITSVAFLNIFNEILGEEKEVHAVFQSQILAILIAGEQKPERHTEESMRLSLDAMKRYFQVEYFAALSRGYEGCSQIPAAVEEATELLVSAQEAKQLDLSVYGNMQGMEVLQSRNAVFLEQMTKLVLQYDEAAAKQWLWTYYNGLAADRFWLSDVKKLSSANLETMAASAAKLEKRLTMRVDSAEIKSKIEQSQTISGVCGAVEQFLQALIDVLRENLENNELNSRVVAYIEEHFSDQNLSVNQIAEHFSLSGSYLTQRFKAQHGVGLLDYINRYRIERSKILIETSQMNLSQIAEQCGFFSTATFTRRFKKYVGTIPSEYRKIAGGGHHDS